jgi:predicted nucleic acid-binding Zn ribbon protein
VTSREPFPRDPVPLRDALAAVSKDLRLAAPDALANLAASWHAIAGADVAAHARVVSLRNGVCTIEVDGPGWATRVRYLTNELLSQPSVTDVKVVVKRP